MASVAKRVIVAVERERDRARGARGIAYTPGRPPHGPVCHIQCHACGYEPLERPKPSERCPKCGGGAWESYAEPGSLLRAVTTDPRRVVDLAVRCPTGPAQVQCKFGQRSVGVIEMRRDDRRDLWRASVELMPGTYRYQFYLDDGRLVIYWPGDGRPRASDAPSFVVPAIDESGDDANPDNDQPGRDDAETAPKVKADTRTPSTVEASHVHQDPRGRRRQRAGHPRGRSGD